LAFKEGENSNTSRPQQKEEQGECNAETLDWFELEWLEEEEVKEEGQVGGEEEYEGLGDGALEGGI